MSKELQQLRPLDFPTREAVVDLPVQQVRDIQALDDVGKALPVAVLLGGGLEDIARLDASNRGWALEGEG